MEDVAPIVMPCDHCGKVTAFKVHCKYNRDYTVDYVALDKAVWYLLECRRCGGPTLVERRTTQDFPPDEDPVTTTFILYPAKTELINLPEAVEKEYKGALKYQKSDPNACAVYVGRALDSLCRHENVPGKRLVEKLQNLITAKNLPAQLGTMADHLRELRNIGAHADGDDEVTMKDAPIMLDFLEAILEYLYVAPAKIAAVQDRLKKTP